MKKESKGMKFIVMPRYQLRRHALARLLREQHAIGSGRSIYEIGYGAGEIFNLYKKMGLQIYGYDFSKIAYDYAKENYQDAQVTLFEEKPEPRGQFDYVVACEVLEHIKDDVAMLKEWKKYLKATGKLIISVPAHKKRWGATDVYAGHYRRYEKEELKRKLAKAGLKMESIYTYEFPACLILDKMRDSTYDKKMKEESVHKSKEEYTKKSGVEREFKPLVRVLSHPALWFLIAKFTELFYHSDLGAGYILVASIRSMKGFL